MKGLQLNNLPKNPTDEQKRRQQASNEAKKEPLFQFDYKTGKYIGKHDCISDASRSTGVHKSDIAYAAKGVKKHAGGFIWVRCSDYESQVDWSWRI